MADSKAIAIVNPRSADGTTGRQWPDLAQMLEREGIAAEGRLTQSPGHAAALTREALRQGASRIIAVGGDGTVNEVINGFFDGTEAIAPQAELGVLCRGTGCDFIKTLGIPKNDIEAIHRLTRAQPRTIDVGRVRFVNNAGEEELRYFGNIAEAGLGGAVVQRVNNSSKALGGFATFLAATLQTFLTHKNQPAEIIIDGKYVRNIPVCNIVIGNGRYFGGGMKVLPQADLSDGHFDVLIMGDFNVPELFANIAKVYQGTHLGHPKVEVFQATSVKVTSSSRMPLDLDGEAAGTTPATFDLVPAALKVLF